MDQVHTPIEQDRRAWHIDKTISVSHILTTLAIAGSVFVWASKMEQRQSVTETKVEHLTQTVAAAQQDVKELAKEVRDEVRMLRIEVRDAMRAAAQERRQ